MRELMIGVALLASTVTAAAADAGWSVQFHYDAFEEKTFPIGSIVEQTEGMSIDPARMSLVCKGGEVGVAFLPTRMMFGQQSLTAKFRGAEGVDEFTFAPAEFPAFGQLPALVGAEATDLIRILSDSPSPVPFRYRDKSGNFPVIGFQKVLAILAEECQKLS